MAVVGKPAAAPAAAQPISEPQGAAPAREAITPFKVRATEIGYYDLKRRRVGDVFVVQRESEFSSRWMERVGARVPERETSGQQQLKAQHDEILAVRAGVGTDVDVI